MPRAVRLVGRIAALLALVTGAVLLFASLQVRAAVDEGALADTPQVCINKRDLQRLRDGETQRIADWWMLHEIRRHGRDGQGMLYWHLQGAVSQTGIHLSYSAGERRTLFLNSLNAIPRCPRPVTG